MASRRHKLYWASSYDRGLDNLLFIWPDIKSKFPGAELHICYGWQTFDKLAANNPERMKWKENVQTMMQQDGIFHHGRVGKKKLHELRKKCGIWAYPTEFTEINCITALECQRDGVVPVVTNIAALKETVGSGVRVEGSIKDPKVKDEFLEKLLELMGDKKKWLSEQKKGIGFSKNYDWSKIAVDWIQEFKIRHPMVSVITITIREGWWNIMAKNLSEQTYKNFEWIILDDHKEDRSKIAQEYAQKYNLDIKYIRGDKTLGKYKRKYGLVRANNKAYQNAKGELTVWLQDFILIPDNGIEMLVDVYRHHPNALIAPTDVYYHCKEPNRKNKEDWWDGETDILTDLSWKNIRNEYKGLRKTEIPLDFEMNYSAIPTKILKDLNGFWEFFDDGLGFDNTEIAYRALKAGYEILIDDTNVAQCIDLWPIIGGEKENIENREVNLNTPRYVWFINQDLDPVRDEKYDESLHFSFETPKDIPNEEIHKWINSNAIRIAESW